jgi:hypothetical protein
MPFALPSLFLSSFLLWCILVVPLEIFDKRHMQDVLLCLAGHCCVNFESDEQFWFKFDSLSCRMGLVL